MESFKCLKCNQIHTEEEWDEATSKELCCRDIVKINSTPGQSPSTIHYCPTCKDWSNIKRDIRKATVLPKPKFEVDDKPMIEFTEPEKKRVYHYPEGYSIALENVTHLLVSDSGNHRVRTADGVFHIILAGFKHIELHIDNWTV